jgi:hypothetical protein
MFEINHNENSYTFLNKKSMSHEVQKSTNDNNI